MNIFITGGTGEIGQKLAEIYLAQGDQIGICGGNKENFANLNISSAEKLFFYEADVTDRDQIADALCNFKKDTGVLDSLICLAGINNGIPFKGEDIDFDKEIEILDTNLVGTVNTIAAAIPNMSTEQGASITLVSSAAGMAGFPETPLYCTSKSALFTLAESLQLRLKNKNIHVGVLAPGYVKSELARRSLPCVDKYPYVMTVEKTAREIKKSIDKKVKIYIFPWQIRIATYFAKYIPRFIFRAFYSYQQRKKSFKNSDSQCCMKS